MSTAHDREEYKSQQPRGRNGVGSSRKKNLEISEGDVPKQKEPKRGRPCSELSEQQKKEKHNTGCRAYRKKKKAELYELQDFKNEFQEEFGSLRPKILKV
ncbi:hypothetical protein SLEP1_g26611 [Rubroshorea leprosula]|uniref:Uncharacterized protein n=1 Tax=Rubroshorea leprosula TaxID=152421 RepID=A0AAV5JWV4_9ROSI|nr:hypothetical protein SLEP1_g26611 [Rubroshorea leprosula]